LFFYLIRRGTREHTNDETCWYCKCRILIARHLEEGHHSYKNRNNGIWARGEMHLFKNLKMADNAIMETHPDGTTVVRFQPVAGYDTPADQTVTVVAPGCRVSAETCTSAGGRLFSAVKSAKVLVGV